MAYLSTNCLPWQPLSAWQAVIICLEKLQQSVVFFYKLFTPKYFLFSVISSDFVVVASSLQKITYKWKNNYWGNPYFCSILMMGGVGTVIASQIRKIIDFLMISLALQKQFLDNTCLNQVLYFIKMCAGLKCCEVWEEQRAKHKCNPVWTLLCAPGYLFHSEKFKDSSKNPAMALCGWC